jgi:hypothetical protein
MRVLIHLHVKGQLELGLQVRVVNFEEAVHEFTQVYVLLALEI